MKCKYNYVIIAVITVTIAILASLLIPGFQISMFTGTYGHLLNNQIIMLGSALFIFIFMSLCFGSEVWKYLSLKPKDGAIIPVPKMGIKPKKGETWRQLGTQMTLSISLITAIVIYFQVATEHSFIFNASMLIVLPLAASNALSEEIIYRFSFVAAGKKLNLSPHIAEITSGCVFGIAHYFGNPGGIPGVIMAGFIGWFLAKSMNETGGFFWAYFIHFVQDVIIFYALILSLT